MSVGEIARTALKFGEDVINGMTGNTSSYVKKVEQKALKSNMTRAQIKAGVENTLKASGKEILNKRYNAVNSKKVSNKVKNKALDKVIGNAVAKNKLGYQIGDMVGGGFRDASRVFKSTKDMKQAVAAGFTTKGKDGKRVANIGRIAGAGFGVSVAGRVVSGGGLYRDRYGRVNAPGIPFI